MLFCGIKQNIVISRVYIIHHPHTTNIIIKKCVVIDIQDILYLYVIFISLYLIYKIQFKYYCCLIRCL